MRSMTGRTLELHMLLPNGESNPLITSSFTAGAFKLSPSGQKVAAVIADPRDRTRLYLTVIHAKTGKRTRLTRCSTLCNYYWYTNNVLVIETRQAAQVLWVLR